MLIFNNYYLEENIKNPLRSGKVKISIGKTTYKDRSSTFLMIDNLAWMFRFNPSFVLIFPTEKALQKDDDMTNATLIYPKFASKNMEFNKLHNGTAYLTTYFFGEPKEDRSFDWFYRFSEYGFRLSDFKGLEDSILKLNSDTTLHISSRDYEHPTFVSGETKDFKVYARVNRKN